MKTKQYRIEYCAKYWPWPYFVWYDNNIVGHTSWRWTAERKARRHAASPPRQFEYVYIVEEAQEAK